MSRPEISNGFPRAVAKSVTAAPERRTGFAPAAFVPELKWDWLLACVAGYILTAVGRVHQLFSVLQLLHPAILTGLLAITLYLLDQRGSRRSALVWTRTTKWLMALLVWMMLSVPSALVAGNSFDLVFGDVVKTVVMYFVLAGSVRGDRDIERLAAVYLLAAALYAAVVLLRFDVGAGSAWRLGRLYYYDANDFATFAITAMPFGLYFLHRGRKPLTKLLAVAALGVLTAAFVNSGSRGGFLALVAVAGFIVLRYNAIALRWRLSVLALVGVVLVGTASDKYWRQMETILSDTDYNHTDETGRLQIWRRGIGYMMEHPIFGVGPNNFGAAEGTLSPFADRQQFGVGVRWNAPHNSLVQVGAELGVPGLVLFVGTIASAFVALRRSADGTSTPREHQTPPELTQALTASLIGFVVGAFFLSLAYSEILYTLIALAVGLEKVHRVQEARRVQTEKLARASHAVPLARHA
jgi:O-antigen ligase